MVSRGRGNAEQLRLAARGSLATSCRGLLLMAIMVGVLSGCVTGGDESADSAKETAEALSAVAASEAVTGPPVLGTVVWSTAIQPGTNEPVAPAQRFPDTTSVLYAVFPVERLAEGTTIRASWTFNGTSLEGLQQELTAPRDQTTGWLEFHLERTNQEPWPDGLYAISLTANGVLIATAEVAVEET